VLPNTTTGLPSPYALWLGGGAVKLKYESHGTHVIALEKIAIGLGQEIARNGQNLFEAIVVHRWAALSHAGPGAAAYDLSL